LVKVPGEAKYPVVEDKSTFETETDPMDEPFKVNEKELVTAALAYTTL
jgi:hypothetical protein